MSNAVLGILIVGVLILLLAIYMRRSTVARAIVLAETEPKPKLYPFTFLIGGSVLFALFVGDLWLMLDAKRIAVDSRSRLLGLITLGQPGIYSWQDTPITFAALAVVGLLLCIAALGIILVGIADLRRWISSRH